MVLLLSVAVQNKKLMQNVNIQNVSHLQKQDEDRGQRRSAVSRKRAVAQGVGGKPTNVKTFTKRTSCKRLCSRLHGQSIRGNYGGVELSNPSYVKYWKKVYAMRNDFAVRKN